MFANENAFDSFVARARDVSGVPANVIKALIGTESSFNPRAVNQSKGDASLGGSYGLTGITLTTAKGLGFAGSISDLYDPAANVMLGAQYMAQQHARYPGASWPEVYGAYNAGSIRKTASGALVNQANVDRFARNLDYFNYASGVRQTVQAGAGVGPQAPPPAPDFSDVTSGSSSAEFVGPVQMATVSGGTPTGVLAIMAAGLAWLLFGRGRK